jgi:DhnA family fructose-bisphosphate aldolase class Ia
MNFNVSLVQGASIIEITGTNNFGQDIETTSIIYQKPNPINPPIVNITNPSISTYTTSQSTKQVVATVLNVNSSQDIEVIINGNTFNNFSYNNASKQVQFNVNLVLGSNQVAVSATNNAGSDNDQRTIEKRSLNLLM